jgi:glycosyltransferase involved in cell wall biosynthesis
MIEALKGEHHQVAQISLTETDWSEVRKMLGNVVKPDEEIVLFKSNFRGFEAYKPLLAALLVPMIRRKLKLELLVNSQADTLPVKSDILYVHYPTFSEFENVDINLKYTTSLFWRTYISPYKLVHRFFESYLKTGILVTNSTYSRKAVRQHTGRNPIVVYPPVEVETFSAAAEGKKREEMVVSCGRYSPEKNYEYMLEAAKRLTNVKFAVVGSFSGEKSTKYYEKLCSMKSEKSLANVELLKTVPFRDLLKLYSEAKIYMHTMKNEHFGIAVIEAMAAGLVPVVYRGGGPWEDILKAKQGYYGFSYETPNEAVAIIKMLLANENLRAEIVKRDLVYVKEFSDDLFKKRFIELVNRAV